MIISKLLVILVFIVAHVPPSIIILYAIYAAVSTLLDIEQQRKVKQNQDYIDRNL